METTYTENINTKTLHWKDLYGAKFAFNKAFNIKLDNDDYLNVEEVVRLVPQRRMLIFGNWQKKPIVAKLFFDSQKANYHREKDLKGIRLLKQHHVPTPDIFYEGTSEDKRISIIIYERIFNAKSLFEHWEEKENVESMMPMLKSVMVELATQHVFGIMQGDLHLKNFLISPKIIYTLDGAEIRFEKLLLSKKLSMQNISLFLSQLGAGVRNYQQILFEHYAKARGWIIKKSDILQLFQDIDSHNQVRWQKFSKKIYRDSSTFMRFSTWRSKAMLDRHYLTPAMATFLHNPEKIFHDAHSQILKAGRSATVIKANISKREFVIKRYNIKHSWHFLKRCFRPTRAYHSWRMANKLQLFGVNTPKPVAFIEKRFLGFRYTSYFINEYIPSCHANEFISNQPYSQKSALIKTMIALLKAMIEINVTHGDWKLTNVLINLKHQPMLIDLDGMEEHHFSRKLHRSVKKEIKRLLQNFVDQPQLQQEILQTYATID